MRITLDSSEAIADGTMAFRFRERPSFVAGQFGEFSLQEGPTRLFSFTNAPGEDLMIATRMREDSAFKNALKNAEPGFGLEMQGPMGRFTLPEDTRRPIVFIAGGIGITPVRSMIRHSVNTSSGHRLALLYANRTIASSAFHDELSATPDLDYVPVLSDETVDGFESGRIDERLLSRYDNDESLFYVVGPPPMVDALTQLLAGMGVAAERVRSEGFSGY